MANYKTSWVQRLIEGAWQKTFAFAHAKTVYTDFANKKTLADKLSEIDTEIGNKANKAEIPTESGYVGSVLDGVYTDLAVLTPTKEAAESGTKEYSISYEFKGLDMSGISDQCFLALEAGGNVLKLCVAKLLSDGTMAQVSTAEMSSIAAQYRVISEDGTVGRWRDFGGELTLEWHLQNYTLAAGLPLFVEGTKLIALPANGGNSATVNGHTVKSDVPENAVFTDTIYDDTEIQKRISDNGYGEVAGGKNLFFYNDNVKFEENSNKYQSFTFDSKTDNSVRCYVPNSGSYTGAKLNIYGLKPSTKYSASCSVTENTSEFSPRIYCTESDSDGTLAVNLSLNNGTTISGSGYYVTFSNIQVEEGEIATEYEPYYPSNKMLAEENSQQSKEMIDIKMLGWSVPRKCPIQNEVNGNQFIQKVGRVDLGSLEWTENNVSGHERLKSAAGTTNYMKAAKSNDVTGNIFSSIYTNISANDTYNHVTNESIAIDINSTLWVYDSYFTDASTFKTAMQGKYLYYELATPITTTIDGNEIGETVSDVRKETIVNLLNPTLQTTTKNGITITNNGDGTYTLDGTASANAYFTLETISKFEDKIYKIVSFKNATSMIYSYINAQALDGAAIYSILKEGANPTGYISKNKYISFDMVITVISGTNLTNEIVKPMLTTNLDATYDDFVPYTGDSGSLNGDVAEKAPKKNPVFAGSVTVGSRLSDTDFGQNSFTNGDTSQARGNNSFATGDHPVSLGANSQSLGCYTLAKANQCAIGHFNSSSSDDSDMYGTRGTAFYVGNGTEYTRSNAFRVDYNGTPYSKAGLNTTGADYAEFFEWDDGNENNEDRRGYFVTLDGKHIKIAKEGDWILGIVSGFPAIIGNGDEEWKGRYVFDDFGCPVIEEFEYEDEEYETITNDDGEEEVITKKVKKTGTKWEEVPEYDPTQPYTGRMQRKEWAAIGMLGVLSVRDDGSCKVNEFCKLADGGIATASDTGYRVVKRVTDNIVEIIFK